MASGINYGLYFDGESSVELGSAESLRLTRRSFTIEVWVKVNLFRSNAFNGDTSILGTKLHGPVNGRNHTLHLTFRNRNPYFGFFNNDVRGATVVKEGRWYHLAFVFNKEMGKDTGVQEIYLDGKLEIQDKNRPSFKGKEIIVLGRWGQLNNFLNGQIFGLKVWDFAMTEAQVNQSKEKGLRKNAHGLIAYWTFKDGVVNRFLDEQNKDKKTKEIKALKDTIAELKSTILKLQTGYGELKSIRLDLIKKIDNLQSILNEKETEIGDLKNRLNENEEEGRTTISSLIMDAKQQISNARTVLKDSDYHLGHVNMQFKVIPSENGKTLSFPVLDETNQLNVSGDALSSIDIEFAPKEETNIPEAKPITIPDVKGFTEIMARRSIVQKGFLVEVKYMAVKDQQNKNRVVKQYPDPIDETDAKPNSIITIFIGKEIM